ncbi:threonine-phosphate decarboxylase CobD [Hoeflea prorocentri]|uniref:threonine-phosphate decarboxylase n=1 Tax=Hoeflea prorocentri TaxID=1922333 RepID=A0A9X3ZHX4_9HYPH|nr:threonine-phosphate decarboxylase CobD [Hoeflea prorocentri]MCY6381373.1 threonine-phosphate decarboxylase CobD [Hoeflea prorocentri]MDA5399173.1 threonine-phosphate decarboxylase CobD [Hoeflea prorocentri]
MTGTTEIETIEHGGALSRACSRYGGVPGEWLDLSTGINPNPVPLPAISAGAWARLPDEDLLSSAADTAGIRYGAADGISPLPVAGTQSVIQRLPDIFSGKVAVIGPTYEEYRVRFERAGRSVDLVPGMDALSDDYGLVVLVNPNNPDGRTYSPGDVRTLARDLSGRGAFLLVDEAFGDLQPQISVASQAGDVENLVVLRSFGKFYGLAGLRLGFVLASPAVRSVLENLLGTWPVSGPALEIARHVLADDDLHRQTIASIGERSRSLNGILYEAGLAIAGNTALFSLVEDPRAAKLHDHLCRHRILTRKFSYMPHWLRFGLCANGDDDERLRVALRAFVDS